MLICAVRPLKPVDDVTNDQVSSENCYRSLLKELLVAMLHYQNVTETHCLSSSICKYVVMQVFTSPEN